MQLDHLNLFVRDVATSRRFYETILPPFGYRLNRDFGDVAVGFGDRDYAVLALVRQQQPVQPIHVAFRFDTREEVDQVYARALESGASDNGEPGLRPHYHAHYYAAFVHDPDGHNVEFVCHDPAP